MSARKRQNEKTLEFDERKWFKLKDTWLSVFFCKRIRNTKNKRKNIEHLLFGNFAYTAQRSEVTFWFIYCSSFKAPFLILSRVHQICIIFLCFSFLERSIEQFCLLVMPSDSKQREKKMDSGQAAIATPKET